MTRHNTVKIEVNGQPTRVFEREGSGSEFVIKALDERGVRTLVCRVTTFTESMDELAEASVAALREMLSATWDRKSQHG